MPPLVVITETTLLILAQPRMPRMSSDGKRFSATTSCPCVAARGDEVVGVEERHRRLLRAFRCEPMLAGQLTPNLCDAFLRNCTKCRVELDVGPLPRRIDGHQRRHLPGVERDDAIDARQIVLRRHRAVEKDAPADLADVDAGQAREQRLELGADRLRRARVDVDVDRLLLAARIDEQQRRRAGAHRADRPCAGRRRSS